MTVNITSPRRKACRKQSEIHRRNRPPRVQSNYDVETLRERKKPSSTFRDGVGWRLSGGFAANAVVCRAEVLETDVDISMNV